MSTETDIAVLKTVVSRLDDSIAAMADVSTNVGKLLAVHSERINQLEKDHTQAGSDIRDIHSRITTMSREIVDKIESTERSLETRIQESNASTGLKLNEMSAEMKQIDDRVGFLERWKWMVLGGAITLGYLIGHASDLANLLK